MSTPQVADFSKKATKKAVLKDTIQHPVTLYPTAIGILGTLSILLFNAPWVAVGAAAGGLAIGLGTWLVNYLFRNKRFARKYLEKLQKKMEGQRQKILTRLKGELGQAQIIPGAEHFATQGSQQFKMIQERFGNLQEILAEKLKTGEITFGRYIGAAEQVYLSVLDNLQNIATLLKSIKNIDQKYIEQRFEVLEKLAQKTEADEKEMQTLEARQKLRHQQLDSINQLLTHNEQALTELDNTTAAVATMKTSRGRASIDLETSIKELEELASRSQHYNLTD